MIFSNPTLDLIARGIVLTGIAMIWVVMLVRINGLRSFSKMTNFDFVMTVAVGSLLAGSSQSTSWGAFAQSLTAMASLFLVQFTTARLRKVSGTFRFLTQNEPVVLMRDGKILKEALTETRVAENDLIAKLREANVLDFSEVRAVVLETTGDISVLHGNRCADELFEGTTSVAS
ncbi:MAG: YetF domain-containing protein [Chthoniobacterales bacterium]